MSRPRIDGSRVHAGHQEGERIMTSTSITAPGLSGVLRMTWLHDDLAHVLEHADTDEPSGTWTGLACFDHGLSLGGDVDHVALRRLAADGKLADLVWEVPEDLAAEHSQAFQAAMHAYYTGHSELAEQHWQEFQAIWSRAWAANYAALELLQNAGITTFSPVKPQRWVIASFEQHCGPHGLPHPHVHNIILTRLTTGTPVAM
jgi:hypothetical protein